MEKPQRRVFAYNLAKTIDNAELNEVSGGSSHMLTRQQTVKGTNNGFDVAYDYTFDGDL